MDQPTENTSQQVKQPRVMVAIPIGPAKQYSLYLLIAALRNLDYENMEIHFAVTHIKNDPLFEDFLAHITQLINLVKWQTNVKAYVHTVTLTKEQALESYGPVCYNQNALRDIFLDGNCDYLMDCGGDNPPPRDTIKTLMSTEADVAFGVCYQRPNRDVIGLGIYPLVWRHVWTLDELDKHTLNPLNRHELEIAWLNCSMIINVSVDPEWKKEKVLWNVVGGTGCMLVKRRVMEMVDWSVLSDTTQHSEDIHFMNNALRLGFKTACITSLHCPHMMENGECV